MEKQGQGKMKTTLTKKELLWLSNLVGVNFECDDLKYKEIQEKIENKLIKMLGELK